METWFPFFFPAFFVLSFLVEYLLGKRWLEKLIPPFQHGPKSPQYFGVVRKIVTKKMKSPARFIFFAGLGLSIILALIFWDLFILGYGVTGLMLGTFSAYFIHTSNARKLLGAKSGSYREILFHQASTAIVTGSGEEMDQLRENLIQAEVVPACEILLNNFPSLKHTHPEELPVKMLRSQNPEIRLLGAKHMFETQPHSLTEHFSQLLDDPFLPVRRFAWKILPHQPPEKAMIVGKAGLESMDPEIRKDSKTYLETQPAWLEAKNAEIAAEKAKKEAKEKALKVIQKVVNLPDPLSVESNPPAPVMTERQGTEWPEEPEPEPEDPLELAFRKVNEAPVETRRQIIAELKEFHLAFSQAKKLLLNPQASLAEDALVLLPTLLDWQEPEVVTAYREYPHRVVREKALEFLMEYWGSPDRREVLRGIIELEKPLEQVDIALFWVKRLGDLSFWSLLLEKHKKWEGAASKSYDAWKLSRETKEALESILRKNGLLDRNQRGVLCRKCLTFGTFVRTETWDHLVCRACKTVENLQGPLREVVGIIGPGFETVWEKNRVFIDLWNESQQSFRYADMDTLEIRGGGEMDYDWAVNAVIEGWMNQRGPGIPNIKVRLVGNPKLSANSRKLLEKIKLSSES